MLHTTESLVQQLKALADTMRLRLIALCMHGECSVSDLTEVSGESQPRISQHLKILCDAGLLVSHRDGKRVFYRVPSRSDDFKLLGQLLQLVPHDEAIYREDLRRLRDIRGEQLGADEQPEMDGDAARALFRAIIDLTVTAPIGAMLDVGSGRGQILKLLASRASRAVGVDIDASARQLARAELMLAGIPNCTLRKGDMYRLAFQDSEFDTIILDDVLGDAKFPVRALREASRVLRSGGRLLLIQSVTRETCEQMQVELADYCSHVGLRLSAARIAMPYHPVWILAVASKVSDDAEDQ